MKLEDFFDRFFDDIEGIGLSGEQFKVSGGKRVLSQAEIDDRSTVLTRRIREPSYLSWLFRKFLKLGTAKKVIVAGKTGYVPGDFFEEHLELGRRRREERVREKK